MRCCSLCVCSFKLLQNLADGEFHADSTPVMAHPSSANAGRYKYELICDWVFRNRQLIDSVECLRYNKSEQIIVEELHMNIQLGKTVRDLRIQAGVTQEDLANHLGVSMQAISRWENSVCYPDLEFVPALAAYFGVSTDYLLCVEHTASRKAEEQAVAQWKLAFKSGRHEEALEIAEKALRAMPTNYRLMLCKVQSLFVLAGVAEERADEQEMWRYLSRAEDLICLIVSKCTEGDVRLEALVWMSGLCVMKEDNAGLLKLVSEFPGVKETKRSVLYRFCDFYEFDEAVPGQHAREYLYELFFEFFYCAYRLAKSPATPADERLGLLRQSLELLHIVVGKEEFGEFEYLMDSIYQMLYELTGEERYAAEVGGHQRKYDALPAEYTYRSVFLNGVVFRPAEAIHGMGLDGTEKG